MANGYKCEKHESVEKRLYALESEDKVMKEKLDFISLSLEKLESEIKVMKQEIKGLKEKMASMTAKITIGGVVIYTLINVVLKKFGG